MLKTPLVSVGMPTYNGSKFLDQSIRCILSQSYSNIEFIISDNASTDTTAKICRKYARRDSRIKYYHQKTLLIPPKNFNFVLNQSKGEYFIWAPDDDLWDKDAIMILVQQFLAIRDMKVSLISPRYHVIDFSGKERLDRSYALEHLRSDTITFEDYLREDFYTYKGTMLFGMFRRRMLLKIGGMYEQASLAAVDIFTLHKLLSVSKIYVLDTVLLYKRENVFGDRLAVGSVVSQAQTILTLIKNCLGNMLPQNLYWLLTRTIIYFDFNQKIIDKRFKARRLLLTILNIYSSFRFFLIFFPHSNQFLRTREITYSRK